MLSTQQRVLAISDTTTIKTRKMKEAQKAVIAFVAQLDSTKRSG